MTTTVTTAGPGGHSIPAIDRNDPFRRTLLSISTGEPSQARRRVRSFAASVRFSALVVGFGRDVVVHDAKCFVKRFDEHVGKAVAIAVLQEKANGLFGWLARVFGFFRHSLSPNCRD